MAPGAEGLAQTYSDDPFQMLAIDIWDGSNAQVGIFFNSTGFDEPILMQGNSVGNVPDNYNTLQDYFFIIDGDGQIVWRGSWHGPSMHSAITSALEALIPSPAPDTPAAGHVLGAGYPNPFNPMTRIPYQLADDSREHAVKLEILDMRGRVIRTLVDAWQAGGRDYTVAWDGTDDGGRSLPSGAYSYRLRVGDGPPQNKVLTLIK